MKIKTLLLFTLFLIATSPALMAQCSLTGYSYRLPITISNPNSSALSNHQVRLTVNTQSLVSAGKMLASGNDIRFTDSLCNNIPYWIESGMNSASTVIWVKVASIPATSNMRVFMNYGNNTATAASNGDSTFLLFDDFTAVTLNTTKWTSYVSGTSTVAPSGGVLSMTTNTMAEVISNASLPVPYYSEIKVNAFTGSWPSLAQLNPSGFTGITLFTDNSQMHLNSATPSCNGYSGYFSNASLVNGIGIWSMSWVSQSDYRATWPGNSTTGTSNSQGNVITSTLRTGFGPLCSGSGSMSIDWVRARKYAALPPTFVTGIEELNRRAFNDAGVSAVNTPAVNFCAGIQPISVQVTNYGLNAINNVMVNWSLNGAVQLPVTYSSKIDTPGSVAGNSAIVNLGSYNFTNASVLIRAWTSNPNSGLDTVRTNDSTAATRIPSMGGVYTIGPTGNYTSFTAAINDLKTRGICAPTTFNIAPGTYYEQVDFDGQVPGASAVNTITFSGLSASNTMLTYNSSLSSARHTLRLANTSFVTIEKLRIQTTGVTYGWPVLISGTSSDLTIKKCSLEVGGTTAPTSTSTEFMGLVMSASNSDATTFIRADRIVIDSNTFVNGYAGISSNSTPGAGSLNMRIRGNTFLFQDIAIQLSGIDNPVISMNTIRLRNSVNSTYGLYLSNVYPAVSSRNVTIYGNKITGFNTYGMYIFGSNHPTGTKGLLANNMVGGNILNNSCYGIYLSSSNRWMIYNNSVNMDNPYTSVAYAGLYLSSSNNASIVNNIFSRTQASVAYCAYITGSTIDSLIYNQFYRPDTATAAPLYLNGNNYFANSIRTLNTGNFVERPTFTNDSTLNIGTRCNNGIYLAQVTTDADGEIRNNPPDIGADEAATFNNDVSVVAVVAPTNPTVIGLNDIRVRIRNTGSNVLNAARISYRLNNGPVRIFNWTGTLGSCDTTTVTFTGLNQGIFVQGINNLLVYSELPNNTFDNNRNNDTVRANLFTAMGGSYTIGGPTPDFATFTDAVNALQTYGVAAPVVFNVAAGSYNEQVTINFLVNGASPVNTITFDGGDGNRATRILYFDNTISSSLHTVLLSGTRYIRFRNLTIRNGGSSYGYTFLIAGTTSRNIHLKNCVIELTGNGAASTSSLFNGVGLSASSTSLAAGRIDSVEVDSNIISGGYYGYYGAGTSGAQALNNTFRYNQVYNIYYAGVLASYQENIKIIGNTIRMRTGAAATNYGVFMNVCSPLLPTSTVEISANRVQGFAYCGIYVGTSNGYNASNKGIISNNMIGGYISSPTAIGLYLSASSRWYVYHNSIAMESLNSVNTNSAAFYLSSTSTQITAMNNIFSRTKAGSGHTLYALSSSNFDVFNYNHFYKADTSLGIMYIAGVTYYPATFKGVNGWNVNSIYRPTSFVSDTNLMITDQCNHGLYMGGYTYDIENKNRNNPPDIGAYEITGIANEMAPEMVYSLTAPVTPGYRYVGVRVRNNGNNAIYAGMLRYIVNNGTPVDTIWNATILPCDTALIQIRLLVPNGASTVKVITVFPNGFADANPNNDTATLNVMTSMSGVYTIGGISPNFNTFAQAVSAMGTAGLAGAVTFNVRNGVYNEQVNLTPVSGISAVNTVTFQAESGNRNQVVLNYAATSAADNYVVQFNGASYFRFKNMTLTASGNGSYGTVALFNNSASNDSIHNCRLVSRTTTSTTTDFAVVNINNTRCDYISVTGSSLLNGSFGVYAQSNILSNYMLNTNLSNDSIVDQYYVGVNLNSVNTSTVQNNIISSNSSYPAYIGVYLSYCNTGVVSRNRISVLNGGAGIYQTNCNGNLGTQYVISNNSIAVNGASTSSYGIYSLYCSFHNFYNNSILVYGNGSFSYGAYLYYTNTSNANNQFKNNVVSNQGGGYAYYVYSTLYCNSDYNNFYGTGSNLMQTGSPNSSYLNIQSWRTASGKDFNSISYRPGFTANTNLTPLASDSATWSLNGRGEQLAAVATDINGNTRSTTLAAGAPDLGAFEFTPTALPPAATASPTTPIAGFTQVFLFGGDTVASITWAPASIVPPAITVRAYSGIYHPNAGAGNILNNYVQATAAGNNLNYTMRLYYKNTWLGTNPSESVLRLSKYNAGTGWTNYLNSNSVVDEVRNIITASGLNSFSDFTGTNNSNPVPVTLLSQHISVVNGYPLLKWATATEKNTDKFEIERSLDGKQFEKAGTVKASGNSAVVRNYQFADYNNPVQQTSYYRLKMIDLDGSFEYAPVMILTPAAVANQQLAVFPNPFNNNLNVSLLADEAGAATLTLFDLNGKTLGTVNVPVDGGNQQFNLSYLMPETNTLPTGLYLLQVNVNGEVTTVKINKQ